MKKLLLLLLAIVTLFLFIPAQLLADTGTYKIDNYTVTLTPHRTVLSISVIISNGRFYPEIFRGLRSGSRIRLTQLPAAAIMSAAISDDSGSGWDGVYIGLDRTYYANQSFIVSFTVNERDLLTESTGTWGINFTPGWYDSAVIDKMDINLVLRLARLNILLILPLRVLPEIR